jgi:hypothetical protein
MASLFPYFGWFPGLWVGNRSVVSCQGQPGIYSHVRDPIEGGCVVLDRREKVDGCLATFRGPANINVYYWYFCVMHNYLYSLVVCINVLVVHGWYPSVVFVYAWALVVSYVLSNSAILYCTGIPCSSAMLT